MDELCEVTITAPDADWLASFVRELVELRLCASGNVTSALRSIYRWRGDVYDRAEALATLHTRRDRLDAIARLANERHPYEIPRLVAVPFIGGSRDYFDWIDAESSDKPHKP